MKENGFRVWNSDWKNNCSSTAGVDDDQLMMMTNWQLQLYNVCNENVQCAMEMCNIKKQFSILFSILHPIPSQWVKPSPLNLFNCSRPPKPNLFSPPLQEFNFFRYVSGWRRCATDWALSSTVTEHSLWPGWGTDDFVGAEAAVLVVFQWDTLGSEGFDGT